MKTCCAQIALLRNATDVIEQGRDVLVPRPEYLSCRWIDEHVKVERLEAGVWETAVALVEREWVKPQQIVLESAGEFVESALRGRISRGDRYETRGPWLARWSAEAIRAKFRAQFGDVREASVRQMRDRVLGSFYEGHRPEAISQVSCRIHDRSGRGMGLDNYGGRPEKFEDLIRYVIHLATGQSPSEVQLPVIVGFNDGGSPWDRKVLFRRQKSPGPGIEFLRFTADGYLEIALTAEVLGRLQSQWDAQRSR